MRGGRIDFRIIGRKHWRPAQSKAGIDPVRSLYDLRHTYATFALRAGVPVFAVSHFIGTSIAMIDRNYGHLANDSREHAVSLLDALALERAVDAAWTSTRTPLKPIRKTVAASRTHRPRRAVDAAPRLCRLHRRREELISRDEPKPSDGLEPSTPLSIHRGGDQTRR
jgi:hypothetical protein